MQPRLPALSENAIRWFALLVFGMALGAAVWRAPLPPQIEAMPAAQIQLLPDELPPGARSSPYRASLTRLTDGRMAVAWLDSGDRETAGIWLAIRDATGWREIGRIASRESTAATTFMHARSLGKPILWSEGGWLHLWYEAYPLTPWLGAAIVHSVSTDGGRHWNRTRRLEALPFGGFASQLGETPVALADGGLLLPLSTNGKDGPWLRLAATGQVIGKTMQLPMETGSR